MMSKNEVTSSEKDTIRRSKEHIVTTTANGKAESTEEATVHDNDLDVFVTMMLLEDSQAGFLMRRNGLRLELKKGESPRLMKDGKL